MNNYRHGDLALIGIKELPSGLKKSPRRKTIMKGSNNNSHSFDNGALYLLKVDDSAFVFGYLVAKNTTLSHPDHGKKVEGKKLREAKIADGVYALRRQFEDTNEGMKQVVD